MVYKKKIGQRGTEGLAYLVVFLKKLEGSSPVAHALVLGMGRNPKKIRY
jgi:hypothetical protein